jgi:hypothetical protein
MGAKQSGSQTVTQQPDALTQEWRKMVMGYGMGALGMPGTQGTQRPGGTWGALGAMGSGISPAINPMGQPLQAVPGMDPASLEAMRNYQGMASAGNLGLGALSGDPNSVSQMMNPYQSNVLDMVSGRYGDLANMTRMNVNDAATRAGAFGGSRHGVAEGVALGELSKGMGQQMAGLQYQGFNDAMGRAQGLANLGLGANGQLGQMGDYSRQVTMSQDPAMRNLQILQGLLSGMPMGMSTTQPTYSNPLGGLLGIAGVAGGLGWNPFGGGK